MREFLSAVPHFRSGVFTGRFPIAELKLSDESFPGAATGSAFNPFIPLNSDDSSKPGAFFEIEIENTADALDYGDMTLATDAEEVSHQEYWFRGHRFDSLTVFWKDFTAPGEFENRVFASPTLERTSPNGAKDSCLLAAHFDVDAGERKTVRFVMSWNFPNMANYWDPDVDGKLPERRQWKNYYASLFSDSAESAFYSLCNWDRLYSDTADFRNTLFTSSLPSVVLDAVSANLSILKSPSP